MSLNKYSLWLYPPKDLYFIKGEPVCSGCSKAVEYSGFHIVMHNRKKQSENIILCEDCKGKIKNRNDVLEIKPFLTGYKLPDECKPILLSRPFLTNATNLDVFEAADRQIGKEEVIDRTKLSGRESFQGAKIGKTDYKAIEEKDKPIDIQSVTKLLDKLKGD